MKIIFYIFLYILVSIGAFAGSLPQYLLEDECLSQKPSAIDKGYSVYVSVNLSPVWNKKGYYWGDCVQNPKNKRHQQMCEASKKGYLKGGTQVFLRFSGQEILRKEIQHPDLDEPLVYSCVSYLDAKNQWSSGWIIDSYLTDISPEDNLTPLEQCELCLTQKENPNMMDLQEIIKQIMKTNGSTPKEEISAFKKIKNQVSDFISSLATSATSEVAPEPVVSHKAEKPKNSIPIQMIQLPSDQNSEPKITESTVASKKEVKPQKASVEIGTSVPKKNNDPSVATPISAGTNTTFKTGQQLKDYMCMQRSSEVKDENFEKTYAKFSELAIKAEKAFNVPQQLILCTALVEGGLYHHPNKKTKDRGFFQFTPPTVIDMKERLEENYQQQWAKYTKRPIKEFTDYNIRKSDDPEIPLGAGSIYLKWLLEEAVPKSGCEDCKFKPYNEKSIFLAISGYNMGPYRMPTYSDQTPDQLISGKSLPKVTRDYLYKIRNCLSKEKMFSFAPLTKAVNKIKNEKAFFQNRCEACLSDRKNECSIYRKKEGY